MTLPRTQIKALYRRHAHAILRTPWPRAQRWSSSASQPSAMTNFYKTFTRPVAKCLLIAILTYQIVYLGWTKLESDEIKSERRAEISGLEAQVKSLQNATTKK